LYPFRGAGKISWEFKASLETLFVFVLRTGFSKDTLARNGRHKSFRPVRALAAGTITMDLVKTDAETKARTGRLEG
jgi:hypothetical protein